MSILYLITSVRVSNELAIYENKGADANYTSVQLVLIGGE